MSEEMNEKTSTCGKASANSELLSGDKYYKNCGDCGQFLPKARWLEKAKYPKCTHGLCRNCESNYDHWTDY